MLSSRQLFEPQPSALLLDLAGSCQLLLASDASPHIPPSAKSILEQWASGEGSSKNLVPTSLLSALSKLLLNPRLVIDVAACFRPLIVDLCARLVPTSDATWDDESTREALYTLAALLPVTPEIYAAVEALLNILSLSATPLLSATASGSTGDALIALNRLSKASPALAGFISKHAPEAALSAIVRSREEWSAAHRLLAIRLLAFKHGLPESSRIEMERQYVGKAGLAEMPDPALLKLVPPQPTTFHPEVSASFRRCSPDGEVADELDAWIFSIGEGQRTQTWSEKIQTAAEKLTWIAPPGSPMTLLADALHPSIREEGGVLFLRASETAGNALPQTGNRFVVSESLRPVMNIIAQAIQQRLPILLSGPASSGKASLVAYLSETLGVQSHTTLPEVVTLQLGDHSSLDAKSLLGSYTSSTRNPGTFEWVEGALTRAVRTGKWLILKDIDKASIEILSVVKPLVEALSRFKGLGHLPELDLGARGRVKAGPTFAMFALRSVHGSNNKSGSAEFPPANFMGSHHWQEIMIPTPSDRDVLDILIGRFPRLETQTLTLLATAWKRLQVISTSSAARQLSAASRRIPSFRDLIQWCRRVESFLPPNGSFFDDQRLKERIFIEAFEVFLASAPPSASRAIDSAAGQADEIVQRPDIVNLQIEALSSMLGLDTTRASWLSHERVPEYSTYNVGSDRATQMALRIGRIELQARTQDSPVSSRASRHFALTRPAACLLERLGACVRTSEPVLLVGETGTGKTTIVQHLANQVGQQLVALNLSQQSEASDLLGSFKPLDPRLPATDLHNAWSWLFEKTFSAKRNARFVQLEQKALQGGKWGRLSMLWNESIRMAHEHYRKKLISPPDDVTAPAQPAKKRKTDRGSTPTTQTSADDEGLSEPQRDMYARWRNFEDQVADFASQHSSKKKNFVFSFIEGPLVEALKEGSWVLLDEINLAATETLDCLASLLQGPDSSVTLFERGDLEPVSRHPDFRLFACMNPATDVGKKDLPANLRSRFTELYVQSPDSDREALVAIVEKHIGHLAAGDRSILLDVAQCYSEIRRMTSEHLLADGANQRPHFSVRTLSRALSFAADQSSIFGLRRAVWEGFIMAFTMLLDVKSEQMVKELLDQQIMSRARNVQKAATFVPPQPASRRGESYIQVGPFWLSAGPETIEPAETSTYVMTASVQAKLVGLARAILARKSPILIQGPTSAGKTSAVEFLAKCTGHRFVRINNHEHTDIQEYLGSYASDPDTGRLVFHEGLLVQALRRGDWIVLDELNLAPTDVLEALNRLLDDNRELIIPETGEVIRPHPRFMLFATQNPPGIYAGRKVLSRAFRNRFLELHFDDVPRPELEIILTNRCSIPPSYAAKIVAVFVELQRRRQANRVFDTKQAFVTLRDLFRWGQREANGYQQLAETGYMLIAERARSADDRIVVKNVIEEIMRVKIDVKALYDLSGSKNSATSRLLGSELLKRLQGALKESDIVSTKAMQRQICLVAASLRYDEPVLLVGETGAGKTSVCEVVAEALGRPLHTINCHQNTETADLLGGQRPLRNRSLLQAQARAEAVNALKEAQIDDPTPESATLEDLASILTSVAARTSKDDPLRKRLLGVVQLINRASALFEWRDGPLVEALRSGDHVLLDEISLADDSVLERLNSVLEPGRTLVLAEKSGASTKSNEALDAAQIRASDGFQVVATMNPGGDYGKKELSPALRNRFTEIWVPQVGDSEDILRIFEARWIDRSLHPWGSKILAFADWFGNELGGKDQAGIGLRDLLAWVTFMNATISSSTLTAEDAFAHGALLSFVDGIGAMSATSAMTEIGIQTLRRRSQAKLQSLCGFSMPEQSGLQHRRTNDDFVIGQFSVKMGSDQNADDDQEFSFTAPTTSRNALKVLRALYVPGKAILLEGSPGAGKTSLISALAKASRNRLTRINLSDQTELIDLFGSDLPVEGGGPGEFAWKDAAFLSAMQNGEWVLLDEMNLASQSVLEGLNSCLDHRGSVYIPELGRSFNKHPDFRFFAAQNPQQQGGGRKGLPKSFLNRFTKVFVDELQAEDILSICGHLYPRFDQTELRKMIDFNAALHGEVMIKHRFGRQGAPWEFNLRDLLRWLCLIHADLGLNSLHLPIDHLGELYIQRFRTQKDRLAAAELFNEIFQSAFDPAVRPWPTVTPTHIRFGHALLRRAANIAPLSSRQMALLQCHLPALEALADCVSMQWLGILVGAAGSGKTSLIRLLARLMGARLEEMRMSPEVDTMDVLGTFEQADPLQSLRKVLTDAATFVDRLCGAVVTNRAFDLYVTAKNRIAELAEMLSANSSAFDTSAVEGAQAALADLEKSDALSTEDSVAVLEIATRLGEIATSAPNQAASGRFVWNDGPLVRALQQGSWLLLDDTNLCSASVLDRLNSLFEPGGSLILSERGAVNGEIQVIKPHPNFRLFMALDPQHGELSRAMRNRGLEIYLASDTFESAEDASRLLSLDVFQPSVGGPRVDTSSVSDTSILYGLRLSSMQLPQEPVHKFLASELPSKGLSILSHALIDNARTDLTEAATLIASFPWQMSDGSGTLGHFQGGQGIDLGHGASLWEHSSISQNATRTKLDLLLGALTIFKDLRAAHRWLQSPHAPTERSVLHRCLVLLEGRTLEEDGQEEFLIGSLLQSIVHTALQSATTGGVEQADCELLLQILQSSRYLLKICQSIHLDYSALQVVAEELDTAIGKMKQKMSTGSLMDTVRTLHNRLRLTSGFAMQSIWQATMPPVSFAEALPFCAKLLTLLSGIEKSASNARLLASAVDIAATLLLPRHLWNSEKQAEVMSLCSTLIPQLSAEPQLAKKEDGRIRYQWETPSLAVLHLFLSSGTRASELSSQSKVASLAVKEVLLSDGYPTELAILIRKQGWLEGETGQRFEGLFGTFAWAEPLMDMSSAEDLFRPFLLRSALFPSEVSRVSLSGLLEHREQCLRLARLISLQRPAAMPSRSSAIQAEAVKFGVSLLPLVGINVDTIRGADGLAEQLVVAKTDLLAVSGKNGSQSARTANFTTLKVQLLEQVLKLQGLDVTDLSAIGGASVALAMAALHLYLPNIAVDPLAVSRCRQAMAQDALKKIEEELQVALAAQELVTGNKTSPVVESLRARRQAAWLHLSSVSSSRELDRQSDAGRLASFFQSVHSFTRQVLNPEMLADLKTAILGSPSEQALAREETLQKSLQNFRWRLRSEFDDLLDLAAPLQTCALILQVGFRMLIVGQTQTARRRKTHQVVSALVAFPTVKSCSDLEDVNVTLRAKAVSSDKALTTSTLLTGLAALGQRSSDGASTHSLLESISRIYEQLFENWSKDREQDRQKAEEEGSLFKSRGIDVLVEDEDAANEAEFRAMFPEYSEDVMEENTQLNSAKSTAKASHYLSPETTRHLHSLHLMLFHQPHAAHPTDYAQHRGQLLKSLMKTAYNVLPESMDQASSALQLSMLQEPAGLASSRGVNEHTLMPSFYNDPNTAETSKGTEVVNNMMQRLDELIREWPQQMVLQHIKDRCEAILRLDSASPVAKVLAALEQLLAHSDDWEGYANSSNSLSAHRTALSGQIIAWRRLELSSWASLLESQSRDFAADVGAFWFNLYEVAIKGTMAAMMQSEDDGKEHLRSLIDLLDQFVRSSTLGNFASRLSLIESFSQYIGSLTEHAPLLDTRGLPRTHRILANVVSFYSQFRPQIASSLQSQRAKIEKDIRDFIQLASWKDVNIHALRQSAQKSHRRLHKSIRQFRDVLRQPVDPLLASASEQMPQAGKAENLDETALKHSLPLESVTQVLSRSPVVAFEGQRPAHLQQLSKTFAILKSMTERQIEGLLTAVHSDGLENLAGEIVSRSQALAKATPALANEENEKAIKNLTNRKRKAWTDLLKELKRIGLSPFFNATLTEQNKDVAYIYEQAPLTGLQVAEGNRSFFSLLVLLPKMRSSLSSAQGDIPMGELQRAVSYCENAVALILKTRARLAREAPARARIQATSERLMTVFGQQSQDVRLLPCSSSVAAVVDELALFMKQTSAALQEIQRESSVHVQLSALTGAGLESFLQDIEARSRQADELSDSLRMLSKQLQACGLLFWTAQEADAPHEALRLAALVEQLLTSAAKENSSIEALCIPAAAWISQRHTETSSRLSRGQNVESNGDTSSLSLQVDRMIDSTLQVAQELRRLETSEIDVEDLADKAIELDSQRMETTCRHLRLLEIESQLSFCLSNSSTAASGELVQEMQRLAPFVAVYSGLVETQTNASLNWLRNLLKLTHVLSNTVKSLALNGFCKPPQDAGSKGGEGNDDKELEGGTGLGDGTGAKDITDQMDDDEEVEELQKGEDADDDGEKPETEHEKSAREAADDIDGDLEDVEGGEEDEQEGDQSDEEGQDQEMDEHVGDVDPLDPNTVDEKIWNGDEQSEKQEGPKDETSKELDGPQGDSEQAGESVQKGQDNSDSHQAAGETKENRDEGRDQQDRDTSEDEQAEGQDEGRDSGNEEDIEAEEDAAREDQGLGRKLDDQAQEQEKLELDEDLKMSDADDDGHSSDGDSLDDLSDDIDGGEMEDNPQSDNLPFDAPEELSKVAPEDDVPGNEDQSESSDADGEVAKNAGEDPMEDDEDESGQVKDEPDGLGDDYQAQAPADGAWDADPLDPSLNADRQPASGDLASSANQSQGSRGQQGRQAAGADSSDAKDAQVEEGGDQQPETLPKDPHDAAQPGSDGKQDRQEGGESSTAQEAHEEGPGTEPNPVKSLGDALKQFQRNLDSIAEASQSNEQAQSDEPHPEGDGLPEEGDVEHIRNDDDAEMQALGAADEEMTNQQLPAQSLEDRTQASEIQKPAAEEIQDSEMDEPGSKLEPAGLPDFEAEEAQRQETGRQEGQQQSSSAFLPSAEDARGGQPGIDEDLEALTDGAQEWDKQEEEEHVDPIPDDERGNADENLESQLMNFRSLPDEERAAKAADLWRSYTSLTSDLAFALCEQLRLILLPTLAARLNGDFRTGKRLNMRKIVPFIASDYAKDKIWLRRTKPSKREYQVLLSLDDSRSMAENHSVHLAYQTLALVSGALTKLEVGDISICRFGDKVQTLHPFGTGSFGDSSGGRILEQLSFEQKSTDMVRLVESTLNTLEEARNARSSSSGSSAADLWQLQIIISDGVCQDHERLRSLLRRANEQRVMIVFVIVDSPALAGHSDGFVEPASRSGKSKGASSSNSILTMSSVKYEMDPQTGKMELKMDRYLDSFPFSYYVVLRRAEDLPDVLATTLRQWGEKIREAS